jgi:tryptophanyl-tRNA synthetase
MNRAHAYKAAVADNEAREADPDFGVTMGLFNYPVLMAADILMFKATHVPVGKDQIQHIEMARDIASRFNHHYGELLVLPEAVVDQETDVLLGLDGRKMSKSYGNTIPLFDTEKKLKKSINKIKTNLLEPGEAKDPDTSTVFQIWSAFATPSERDSMRREFEQGIAWGEAKKRLYELINDHLSEARGRYDVLMKNPDEIERVLQKGAIKAREHSAPLMKQIREAVGIASMA